jgi:hypothetical protein
VRLISDSALARAGVVWPVAAACLLFVGQGWLSLKEKGATYDEVAHIAAAHDYMTRGEYVLNTEHPPLTKQLAGLALRPLRLQGRVPDVPPVGTADVGSHYWGQQWLCGRALLVDLNGDRRQTILTVARLPLLCLGIPLLVGLPAAAVALMLATFSPNLLAHARLVHTDFALTVSVVLALASTWSLKRRCTWPRVVGLGVICGLALCSKYSALLLGPMLGAVGLAELVRHRSDAPQAPRFLSRRGPAPGRSGAALEWLSVGVVVGNVALALVLLCTWSPDVTWWLRGYSSLFKGRTEGYWNFCAGNFSQSPLWYFYPLTLAVKIPVGAWGLIAAGLVGLTRLERARRGDVLIHVLLPAGIFVGIAMAVPVQYGVRHVLPVLPLLFVLGGIGGQWLWSWGKVGRGVLSLLLVSHLGASVWVAPDYISFFNAAAGGPRRGFHWLDDSNVDWGQDVPALSAWHRELKEREPDAEVVIIHFGSLAPGVWDPSLPISPVNSHPYETAFPRCDYLVMSQHRIPRMKLNVGELWGMPYRWDRDELIHEWIRNSFAVFRLREAGDGSGDVVIEGEESLRIPRDQWLGEAQTHIARLARAMTQGGAASRLDLLFLRRQGARFFDHWSEAEEAERQWEALDRLARAAAEGGGVDLDQALPGLREDLIGHWEEIGKPGRARFHRR